MPRSSLPGAEMNPVHRDPAESGPSRAEHWETVYRSKPATAMSWFRPRLERSLYWIERLLEGQRDAALIDVGTGQSTLAGDLLDAGFSDLTLVDLAPAALARLRESLAGRGERIRFIAGDITRLPLPARHFRLWHDRAVFHFLTSAEARRRYVEQAAASVVPGGHAVIATFALDGPRQCSQLEVVNYDAQGLAEVFAQDFELVADERESHVTPAGKTQQFQYAILRRRA